MLYEVITKIIRGGSDKSFGLHVAMLAGIPDAVLARGEEILQLLEQADINNVSIYDNTFKEIVESKDNKNSSKIDNDALLKELADEILAVDLTVTTPIEAFMLIKKYKDKLC